MSIRLKLMLSYLAMAFVPLVLMTAVLSLMIYMMGYQDMRDFFEKNKDKEYRQAVQFGEMWYVLHQDTSRLQDNSYLREMEKRMEGTGSGFVVSIGGKLVYASSLPVKGIQPERMLEHTEGDRETIIQRGYSYEVFHVDFILPDGSPGHVALFRISEDIPVYWRPLIAMALLIAVGLISALMAWIVARTITRPLFSLRSAALSLKEGNLEPVPVPRSKNEIGQVGTAFDEMRQRLKDTIEQMQQYEENRKMLLSHISHDLKTPITAVRGYVEGMLDGVANTPEKQEKYLRTIYRKAADMDRLIEELFLYSKLDLHQEEFHFRPVNLRTFIQHYLEEKQFELEKWGISLSADMGSVQTPIYVRADLEKLGRVLENMLDNSAKYMSLASSDERSVCLGLRILEGYAEIRVDDTGPGIEEAALPYVFDRFYRAELSRNSETGGSGLGLAIVRQIAEGHGGSVQASNRIEGGASFTVRLPLAPGDSGGDKA